MKNQPYKGDGMFKFAGSLSLYKFLIGIVGCIFISCSLHDSITQPDHVDGQKVEKLYGKWNLSTPRPKQLYAYYVFTDSLVFARGAWFQDSEILVTTIRGDWYIGERKEIEGQLVLAGTSYDSTFYLSKDSTVGKLKKANSGSDVSYSSYPEFYGSEVYLDELTFCGGSGKYYDKDVSFNLNSAQSIEDQTNRAPVFMKTSGQISTDAGKPVSIRLKVSDPDWNPLTLSIVGGPKNGILNQSTKTFTWQPEKSDTGLNTLIFAASDGKATAFDTFTINVCVNRNPLVLIIPKSNYSATAGDGLLIAFKAQDSDSDSVSVKIEKGPNSAYIKTFYNHDSLYLSWLPTVQDTGRNVIVVSASDGLNTVMDSIIIDVKPHVPTGSPPIFYNTDKHISTLTQIPVSIQLIVSDPDGIYLGVKLVNGPKNSQFNLSQKIFSWQPANSDTGLNTVIFLADDGQYSVFDTFTINVLFNKNQNPPFFTMATKYGTTVGEQLKFNCGVSDPDGDPVTVKIEDGPFGAYMITNSDSITRTFVWQPNTNDTGSNKFVLSASDGQHKVFDTVLIAVKPKGPNLPVFSHLDSLWTAYADKTLTIEVTTTNPPSDSITVGISSASVLPLTSSFTGTPYSGKGTFVITPSLADTGLQYMAVFTAWNIRGYVSDHVSDTIKIRVEK